MAKKRRKANQQGSGRVLPEPPTGFDMYAHQHHTLCKLYNIGLVRFGTVDRFMIVTSMTCLDDVMQNLDGSMTHGVVDLGSVLGTEPGFLERVGLVKPPGHGYVRYLWYDLSQPTSPMITIWFNPLVGDEKRYIKGDAPISGAIKHYHEDMGFFNKLVDKFANYVGVASDDVISGLEQVAAAGGPKFEEGKGLYKSKAVIDTPDGGTTGVVVSQEVFDRAVDILEGVMVGGGHRATKEDLQKVKDAKVVSVVRGEKTEPLFKTFGVITKWMSLTVEGYTRRIMGDY